MYAPSATTAVPSRNVAHTVHQQYAANPVKNLHDYVGRHAIMRESDLTAHMEAQTDRSKANYPRPFVMYSPDGNRDQTTKFYLDVQNEADFWRRYCDCLHRGLLTTSMVSESLSFGEGNNGVVPFRLTFNLALPHGADWELPAAFLLKTVAVTQQLLTEMLKAPEGVTDGEETMLLCVMMERDTLSHVGNSVQCLKFILHFPFCHVNIHRTKSELVPLLCTRLNQAGVLKNVQDCLNKTCDEIIDMDAISDPYVIFGSTPDGKKTGDPLDGYRIFKPLSAEERRQIRDAQVIESTSEFEIVDESSVFNIDMHHVTRAGGFASPERAKPASYWMPLFLSTGCNIAYGAVAQFRYSYTMIDPNSDELRWIRDAGPLLFENLDDRQLRKDVNRTLYKLSETEQWFDITTRNQEDVWLKRTPQSTTPRTGVVSQILKKIDPRRVCHRSNLENIAHSLLNTCPNEATQLFNQFVQRNVAEFDNHPRSYFDDIMTSARENKNKRLTIATLLTMMRTDDRAFYELWWMHLCDYYILNSIENNMSQHQVAMAFFFLYMNRFCYAPSTNSGTWYYYAGTHWVVDTQQLQLTNEIAIGFPEKIKHFLERRRDEGIQSRETKTASFRLLLEKLGNGELQRALLAQLKGLFGIPNFNSMRDSVTTTTACNNCVLEVSGNRILAREGYPEDMITRCTGIEYQEALTRDSPECMEVETWLKRMFRHAETAYEYTKKLASILEGCNSDKKMDCHIGPANGGKSAWTELIFATLGQADSGGYVAKVPMTYFVGNRTQSSGATPEIFATIGARLATSDEAKRGQEIDAGVVKHITGGERVWTRALFGDGGLFTPQYKFFLLSNYLPPMDDDSATEQRVMVWPITGRFVLNPEPGEVPDDPADQDALGIYRADTNLKRKFPSMARGLLALMVRYFPLYKSEGVRTTDRVREETKKYWETCNPTRIFVKECLIPEPTGAIRTDVLFEMFRDHHRLTNGKEARATRPFFIEDLKRVTKANIEDDKLVGYVVKK
jgi:phage/plasmid-associated DNA primase